MCHNPQRPEGVPEMDENDAKSHRVHNLKEKASTEFRKFLIIFLYLWIVFATLSIHESIIRAKHGLDYTEHGFAIINALVLAKVILVGDYFQLGTRFKDKPLVYPVLHKCLVFSVLLMGFHLAERMIVGIAGGKSASESFAGIGGGTLRSTISMSVLAFVMLIPFFAFRELGRMIGEQKLLSLFLGTGVHGDVGKPDRNIQSRDESR
jgi:hypothetical protein